VPVVHFQIKALAPLVFSERRPGGQFRLSTPYVPGAVLRGALAQQFLDAGEHLSERPSADFETLFTADHAPLFRNAYPALFDEGNPDQPSVPSRPLPATAYSCKSEGGFMADDKEDDKEKDTKSERPKHGVFDGLIDRLCREELRVNVPYMPRCNNPAHKGKDGGDRDDRVEAFTGFYAQTRSRTQNCNMSGQFRGVNVPVQLTTRVALNRRRKVSEEGLLYSPVVINEAEPDGTPTAFRGSVIISERERAMVGQRLIELTHIGSGVARGLGHVEVQVVRAPADDLADRLDKFNNLLACRWELWSQLSTEPHAARPSEAVTYFVVGLVSDAVLRAKGWLPTLRLEPEFLVNALAGAELLRCYSNVDYRGGWNTAWGLPKDTEPVARMGGVYIYRIEKRRDDAELLRTLRELEERGVGERRVEGFGEVRVCDEFHLEIQEAR
jgi:CRISPR-associated protein Csx10